MGGAAIVPKRGGRSYRMSSHKEVDARAARSPAASWPYGQTVTRILWTPCFGDSRVPNLPSRWGPRPQLA